MRIMVTVLPWWGPLVMSETLTLQLLQLQGRRHGLHSAQCPARIFPSALTSHVEVGRERKNRLQSLSPRSLHFGRRVGLSGNFHFDFIGWNRIRRDQMSTMGLRQLGAGCDLSGPVPFYTNPYWCLGKALWPEQQQQRPSVVGVSHQMSQHHRGHRILSQILNPLASWGVHHLPVIDRSISGQYSGSPILGR